VAPPRLETGERAVKLGTRIVHQTFGSRSVGVEVNSVARPSAFGLGLAASNPALRSARLRLRASGIESHFSAISVVARTQEIRAFLPADGGAVK
jgi:hypothetical protein